jgi:hypothetical protein
VSEYDRCIDRESLDSRGELGMRSQPCSFGEEADAKLAKMAEDWVSERYDDALAEACALFLTVKDDRASQLRAVAIEFVRQSVTGLKEGSGRPAKQVSACSFCGRAAPKVRLGAGAGVFICNECVETFHSVL